MAELKNEKTAPRPGFVEVECDEDLTIYNLATFDGEVFAATDNGIYRVEGNKLVRL